MAHEAVSEGPSSIEELRRRVYAVGATDEDRARYRAALEAAKPPAIEEPPPPSPAAPGRRRPLLPIAGAAAVIALLGVAALQLHPSPTAPRRTAPVAAPRVIAVDDGTRSEFIQNFVHRGVAGIAAYLVTHRSPATLHGATRFYTLELHGTGPQLVSLDPVPAEAEQGRVTVLLVTEWAGRVGWTAYRVRFGGDGLATLEPQADRAGAQEGGVPTTASFSYGPGERPVSLRIEVPDGVPWGAGVVFSD